MGEQTNEETKDPERGKQAFEDVIALMQKQDMGSDMMKLMQAGRVLAERFFNELAKAKSATEMYQVLDHYHNYLLCFNDFAYQNELAGSVNLGQNPNEVLWNGFEVGMAEIKNGKNKRIEDYKVKSTMSSILNFIKESPPNHAQMSLMRIPEFDAEVTDAVADSVVKSLNQLISNSYIADKQKVMRLRQVVRNQTLAPTGKMYEVFRIVNEEFRNPEHSGHKARSALRRVKNPRVIESPQILKDELFESIQLTFGQGISTETLTEFKSQIDALNHRIEIAAGKAAEKTPNLKRSK